MIESGSYSPETIYRRQKIADQLLLQAVKPREIRSPLQGLGQLGEAALAGWEGYRAGEDEKTSRKEAIAQALEAFGGGSAAPAAMPAAAAPAPNGPAPPVAVVPQGDFNSIDAMAGLTPDQVQTLGAARRAVGKVESGNNYSALGPVLEKGKYAGDRGIGAYQVMGKNVGPWTQEVTGKRMDPTAFRDNQDAQDAVFNGKFGQSMQKYGNPLDAASVWFSGRPQAQAGNAADVTGTTTPAYVQKVASALGPQGGPPVGPPGQPAPTPAPAGQNAPAGPPGGNRAAIIAAMLNPWTPPALAQHLGAQLDQKFTYQTTPDGDILQVDPYGRSAPKVVYQSTPKPITVPENSQLWDPRTKSFIGGGNQAPTSVPGPDGKPIAVPPGLSRKDAQEFTKKVTESTADAATGKKTEVQAKDEKFANKMELAEKNIVGVESEGTSRVGRGLDAKVPGLGLGVPFGNSMQSDNYQKYRQARDNFITALLRDESGAAIGTAEFERYEKEMFPQPGDGKAVIDQKREARRVAIEAMKKGAGPGYKSPTAAPGVSEAPQGVDAKVWAAMTPQERDLWK